MSATASHRRVNASLRKLKRINMYDKSKYREGWDRIWGKKELIPGKIEDVHVYDRELTSEEIEDIQR